MSQPVVNITELNGALGVSPSGDKLHAAIGVGGTSPVLAVDTPASFARTSDIVTALGGGPLCEYGCWYVETYHKPILLVRTGQTTAGTPGTLVISGVAGTSVVTLAVTAPNDDYEFLFKVIAGGTIGVAGITYQYSLDGGRTLSATTALGTANTFAFPGSGGVTLNFAAGTLIAGDNVTSRGTAPNWNTSELTSALTALGNTSTQWREVNIVGVIDANAFDAIELRMSALSTAGKPKMWLGNGRVPAIAESEATYLAAMNTIFSSKASDYGALCFGAQKMTSAVSGRKYKRPASWATASRQGSVSEEINIADVNLGPLVGTSIRDSNGNADEHDETLNPGADDAKFCALRTWDGFGGVFVNRPRLFCNPSSDFQLMPHRLVMNLAREAARLFLIKRLNKPVLVNTTTGKLLEE